MLFPLYLSLITNFIQFTPWDWDNIKVLVYFYVGSIPFVTYGLAALLTRTYKVIPIVLSLSLVFCEVLSIANIVPDSYRENTTEEVELAEKIKVITEPKAVFLTAPIYNHFIFLTGRRAFHGFPGHL